MIYVYDDYRNWGRTFQLANNNALMFRSLDEVPEGAAVFFPVGHAREYRNKMKALAEKVNKKANIWPNIHEIRIYDDKIVQYKTFSKWYPRTWIITSESQARNILCNELKYPFISKGSEGSGSKNNTYVDCPQLAELEIRAVFNNGIPRRNYTQKGYLFWQEFVPDNDYTWRMCVIDKRFVFSYMKFINRSVPFASGDDLCITTIELDDEVIKVMDFALDFCIQNDLVCEGIDIVIDKGQPRVLETACCWGPPGHVGKLNAIIYEKKKEWVKTDYTEDTMFNLIGNEIFNGRVLQKT